MSADHQTREWEHIPFNAITICEEIGGGGAALVYRGVYQNENVALKSLFDPRVDEELKQEFMDELHVLSKVQHPNVVALIGACLDPPNLCMVMELCEGSLHDSLHVSRSQFAPQYQLKIASDIACGMRHLHAVRPAITHRDLKSANVLLNKHGNAKLCDFGLARSRNSTAGTPSYMPPELLAGQPFSKAVDVYMFGVVLWEIYTQEIPYRGYDADEVRRQVLDGRQLRVPSIDCPEPCQALIKKCWSKDPAQRPTFEVIYEVLTSTSAPEPSSSIDNLAGGDALDSLLRCN